MNCKYLYCANGAGMKVYLFWSEKHLSVFGFTSDAKGRNMPAEFAPWSKNEQGEALFVSPKEELARPDFANPILRVVHRDGFYLCTRFMRQKELECSRPPSTDLRQR
jgi:hypothetical protein